MEILAVIFKYGVMGNRYVWSPVSRTRICGPLQKEFRFAENNMICIFQLLGDINGGAHTSAQGCICRGVNASRSEWMSEPLGISVGWFTRR